MWFTGERDGWGDLDEDQALTTVSPFPTSLQVFASVGGLALLAEHLPLLYPEVSRQSILQESGLDYMIKNMSLAEEWSMVEPFPEDFYEVGCWFVESLSWRRYILWEKILQHASEPSYYCVHLVLYVEYLFSVWNNALKCDFFFSQHYEMSQPLISKTSSPPVSMPTIPPHSLVAFGLFLRLPGYAEVLLKERKKAQCLLRLVLGVTDDGDGGKSQ